MVAINEVKIGVGGKGKIHTKFQSVNTKTEDHLEDLSVVGRIILNEVSKCRTWKCRLYSTEPGKNKVAGKYQHGNRPSASIKWENIWTISATISL